jgi:hypothetical protein
MVKLAERALWLEAFTARARVTVAIDSVEYDAQGQVKKTSRTVVRTEGLGPRARKTLLHHAEDGVELTHRKRAQLEGAASPAVPRSPLHPDEQTQYRFWVEREADGLVELGFTPKARPSAQRLAGTLTVDPSSGELVRAVLRPAKLPPLVEVLTIECQFQAQTSGGRALSAVTVQGTAGALFFKKRFAIDATVTHHEEDEAPAKTSGANPPQGPRRS